MVAIPHKRGAVGLRPHAPVHSESGSPIIWIVAIGGAIALLGLILFIGSRLGGGNFVR
jgi:hypothetical protein